MQHPIGFVHDHARRGERLERVAVGGGLVRGAQGRRRSRGQRLDAVQRRREPRRHADVGRDLHPLINARLAVDGAEHPVRVVGVLRGAEKEIAVRPQCEVKRGADLLLKLAVEIDQHVAAGDEIGARKRRVLEQAVAGEEHGVAQFAGHAVVVALPGKETLEPLLGQVGFDRKRIAALAGKAERHLVEVGGEHLDLAADVTLAQLLKKQNRDRIGLLASGAAGHPGPDGVGRPFILEEDRHRDLRQFLEGGHVAKEGRDGDQKIGEQRLRLRPALAQDREIIG